jgi:CubicO group peptidase (beta-lactamase class C family)
MKSWILCAVYAVWCEVGLAQGLDDPAMKARLDQVASSYTASNAFMGTVLVAEGDRILLNKGYGMASLEWEIPNAPDEKDGMKVVEHGGAIPGFTSFASYLPERGVAVVVLTNVFDLAMPVIMADQLLDVALASP